MSYKLFISIAAAVLLAGCTAWEAGLPEPRVFQASVEDPGTKTYLDDGAGTLQMFWTRGDAVSVFCSDGSGKYLFDGDTGSDHGPLRPDTDAGLSGSTNLNRNYALYPYADDTSVSADGIFSYEIPAEQTYAVASFGPGAAVMVAATRPSDDDALVFKNAVGFLVLQMYGTTTVKSVSLQGNAGEPLSGRVAIAAAPDAEPALSFTGDAGTTLTLDCGEGVSLGASADAATAFWIAVAPTVFSKGITVTVTDIAGKQTVQKTNSAVTIVRSVYQPMAPFSVGTGPVGPGPGPDQPDPEPVVPDLPDVTGTLPVLYVYTPDGAPVVSKDEWLKESHAYLKAADGTVSDLGTASIKGRGNTTWRNFDKKPYALKLDKKAALLGMPKDKRWDLLANAVDRTRLRNDIAFELGRRLSPDHGQHYFDWTPRGEYVELVLNGTHMGNYYLVEHIKIAQDRVNITEMTAADITEPGITGGYLLEMSTEMDEVNQFYTNAFPDAYPYKDGQHRFDGSNYRLPVMVKDPDEDVMQPAQLAWLKDYVNTLQGHIVRNDGDWTSQVDMDSFICWMFVQEVVGNYECFHPKSAYLHKDRGGKLAMGPLWDFDYGTFKKDYRSTPVYHYSIWYPQMLQNGTFKARVKELWPIVRPLLRDVANTYVDARAAAIKASVERDWAAWPTSNNANLDINLSFDAAVASLKAALNSRLDQMTGEVNNM